MDTALVPKSTHLSLPLPANGVDSYIQAVNRIPVLSAEHETALAEQLQQNGDLEAARQLVMSHLRFVVHIARGYSGYGLALADLIQEGNVGLMKAVKRFDPERGVRLVSFAVHWIKAEIHEFVLRNWRIVKVATTKAQRKLFFNLRGAKKRLGWLNQTEVNQVADDLGVSPETVLEMESRLSGNDLSFDNSNDFDSGDSESATLSPSDYLQSDNADPAFLLEQHDWQTQSIDKLQDALQRLDARSRDILQQRWLNEKKATLHQLAENYGVSAERIRQLEAASIKKLQACF